MFTDVIAFCEGALGVAIGWAQGRASICQGALAAQGTGEGEDLKSTTQRDGVREFETGFSWRCSMEGQRQQMLWVETSQGPFQPELLFRITE